MQLYARNEISYLDFRMGIIQLCSRYGSFLVRSVKTRERVNTP